MCLADFGFPSLTEVPHSTIKWKGRDTQWKGNPVDWKTQPYAPNTTVIYDIGRNKWYKDGFGIHGYSKDSRDRLYGILNGNIVALYDDPEAQDLIHWEWHSNYLMMPARTQIFNVCART